MPEPRTRLALLTPHRVEAAQGDALAAAIEATCAAGDVAALILRLGPADERSLVNLVKRLSPPAQAAGAAVLVACPAYTGDLVSVAARGGADGVHVDKANGRSLQHLRERLRDGRILGAGGHETRHAAMEAGEAGADYVLFGGLYPDGVAPDALAVLARVEWWTEIFETPCVAVATQMDEVTDLVRTGAEFLGLEGSFWLGEGAGMAKVRELLTEAGAAS